MKSIEDNLAEARAALDREEETRAIDMALVSAGARYICAGRVLVRDAMNKMPDKSVLDCCYLLKQQYPKLFYGDCQ